MKWVERFFFLGLGITVAFLVPYIHCLNFKYDFDVVSVFNLLVTILAVYYVGTILSQRYASHRVEKDLLITQAKELMGLVKAARALFINCFDANAITSHDASKMLSLVKNIANEIAFLEESVGYHRPPCGIGHINGMKDGYSSYRTALTGGSFPGSPYTIASRTAMERTYKDFRRHINAFILEVNRG